MRISDRTAVRPAVGKRPHRRRSHELEALQRLGFKEDHRAGEPSNANESCLEGVDSPDLVFVAVSSLSLPAEAGIRHRLFDTVANNGDEPRRVAYVANLLLRLLDWPIRKRRTQGDRVLALAGRPTARSILTGTMHRFRQRDVHTSPDRDWT